MKIHITDDFERKLFWSDLYESDEPVQSKVPSCHILLIDLKLIQCALPSLCI